jgi:hypothetical protein
MTVTAPKQAALSPRSEGATHTHASHGKELHPVTWTHQGLGSSAVNGERTAELILQYTPTTPCDVPSGRLVHVT